MNSSEKTSSFVLPRLVVIAAAIIGFQLILPQSVPVPARGESLAVCNDLGTRFRVGPQSAAGRLPRGIAAGDFNKDGLPDLAILNLTPNSERQLSVLMGNGRGEFANASNVRFRFSGSSSFNATNAIAVGDLNGDERDDLVMAVDASEVNVLISRGDGAFAAPRAIAGPATANSAIVADLNGDNKNDLVASFDNGQVRIMLGNGDGTFGTATNINAGSFSSGIGGADLNNDGKLDLAVFAGSSSSTYINNGSGGFARARTFDSGSSGAVFAFGDFNGDDKADLVTSGFSGASLRFGDGMGGFGQASSLGISASFLTVADLNLDNRSDLIAVSDRVLVLLGNGTTGFGAPMNYAAGRFTVGTAVADFNRDGLPDVAALNQGSSGFSSPELPGTVSFLAGQGGGRMASASPLAATESINSITVTDLNRDNRPDLVVTAGSRGATSVYLSNGQGGFAATQTYGFTFSSRDYRSVAFADFNNDGLLDLATLWYDGFQSTAGTTTLFPGVANGVFNRDRGVDFRIGNNPDSLVAADFNRDGFPDLAACNLNSHDISVLFNDRRGGLGMETRLPSGLEPRSIVTADFNGDGNPDLAVANRNSATVSALFGDGRGAFNHSLIGIGANPRSLTVADVNADGRPDLVIPKNNLSMASVLLNNGSGNFGLPIESELARTPSAVAVADFNGDGKLDLAASGMSAANSINERFSILHGDGTGKFAMAEDHALPAADLLAAGDFNADGLIDLSATGQAAVWMALNGCNAAPRPGLANVSSANFRGLLFSPEMIVTAFGSGFTNQTASASSLPLPTQLSGVTLKVKDNLGMERPAPLFFAAPGQVNYLMPAGTGGGSATVTVTGSDNRTYTERVLIAPTAPGLFTANSDGQGVPAASIFRIKYPGGEQSFEPVAQLDPVTRKFVPLPIDFGPGFEPAADQLFLVLYGSGLRLRGALSEVTATIGLRTAEVMYAGPVPNLAGLDQINLRLSRNLQGAGEVNVAVTVDGKPANVVRVAFR